MGSAYTHTLQLSLEEAVQVPTREAGTNQPQEGRQTYCYVTLEIRGVYGK